MGGETTAADMVVNFGPWGLIAFFVLAVFRGWIVPRQVMDDIRQELTYSRAANKELIAQRDAAWEETAKLATVLSMALPRAPTGQEVPR